MKMLKKDDIVVCIHPRYPREYLGKIETLWDEPYNYNEYCLAPSPDQRFEVGDWVLPVTAESNSHSFLLKPTQVKSILKYCIICGDVRWDKSDLASIRREGTDYIIGDSCRLSAEEFVNRYGCDPIPVHALSPSPNINYRCSVEPILKDTPIKRFDEQRISDLLKENGATECHIQEQDFKIKITIYGGNCEPIIPVLEENRPAGFDLEFFHNGQQVYPKNLKKDRRNFGVDPETGDSHIQTEHGIIIWKNINFLKNTKSIEPHDSDPPECTDIPNPDWPTPKDIEECCGVWKRNEDTDTWVIRPGDLQIFYTDRHEFDNSSTGNQIRIEPIPNQCIPGYKPPKRETPEWMRVAVEKYPSQGEWD